MKKILNNRPIFYCFVAFGFGVLVAKPIFSLDILCCVLVGLCFFALCFLCVMFKKIVSIVLMAVCFAMGLGGFLITNNNFSAKNYGVNALQITGRVGVVTVYENSENVILDNVYVGGQKISECVNVHIYECTTIEEGTILTFEAVLKNNALFTLGSFNSYNYKYNIHYSCSVSSEDVVVDQTNVLTWSEKLRLSVKQILFKNMNIDEASVSYASLFGDKTYISSQIKTNFSVSGIAHLLAVSGLHIGFLVSLLTFLLNKLKLNKYLKTGAIVAILVLYCWLCNFSASVLRASIMFFILNLSSILGKRYDRLNSWSFAGLICLLIKPLSVYDGGFLLSFGSVLCIFMFEAPLKRLFQKWHIPKKLASTLGVMVPVQFGLIPLLSLYYSKISLLSLLTNFICVPLFEIFFVILFLIVSICLILPFMIFLLVIPKFLIGIIISIAGFFASLDFAIINLTTLTGVVVVAIYVFMFIFSHFVNLTISKKFFISFGLCVMSLFVMIMQTYMLFPHDSKITVLNSNKSVYFLELNQTSIAIGYFDNQSIEMVENYANVSRLYAVDYFISLGSSYKNSTTFKNTYTCVGENRLEENLVKNNVHIVPIWFSGIFAGVSISCNRAKILFVSNNSLSNFDYVDFGNLYNNYDIIIGRSKNVDVYKNYIKHNYQIIDGQFLTGINQTNVNKNGNWTFELKDNIITNMRGVD